MPRQAHLSLIIDEDRPGKFPGPEDSRGLAPDETVAEVARFVEPRSIR